MKTIKRSELSNLRMVAGNEKKYSIVIDGEEKKEWVGIGWIVIGVATSSDFNKYPIVKGDER